ncbi:hypothetical protein [Geoalkalibacter halelectricus]|uniref:WYL domain-containing protein n=1 Tax=Geoalkalibacter halelectricus TaxID=2847045 RepID=A0ABY5ZK91_9BACT|nr:hypothetical protein [Geoalkalibacter halelectricus]MDO3377185.1 hypothetical protein [Geoalkalibacter halelectricus]UWZ79473.1 hypothetical protein L9S41_17580 [Geoalkalibacter halelectricus]
MDTSIRYLLMLQLLPVYPRKISVKELREELITQDCGLDICERTLQRDLVKLSQRFPITSDDCKPRGWSRTTKEDFFSDVPLMTTAVAKALRDVERLAGKHLPKESSRILQPLFAQARAVLGKSADCRVDYRSAQPLRAFDLAA